MGIKLLTFSQHTHTERYDYVHIGNKHTHRGDTTAHTEDTTKATRSHSGLIYTAAIQTRIAEDV